MSKQRIEYVHEDFTQVRSHGILRYCVTHPRPERRYKEFTAKTYSGQVTSHAARRIKKTIDLFLQLSPEQWITNPATGRRMKFRLSFITLTISSKKIIGSKEGYEKLLAPFLRWLRAQGKCSYVWKGELQQRGQPHWHITSNIAIHHTRIRDAWNNLQSKQGLLDEYFAEHGHRRAPSTEIQAVHNLKRIDLYLAKYISKAQSVQGWQGKTWSCSDNLKRAKHFSFSENCDDFKAFEKAEKELKPVIIDCERARLYDTPEPKSFLCEARRTELESYLKNLK